VMNRKLRDVEKLPEDNSAKLLGLIPGDLRQEELEDEEAEEVLSPSEMGLPFDDPTNSPSRA
ncbi:MAG TPA: hypothetical protein VFK86_19170, partial [Bauldia sp.]|nr:hypothetical protein [Bauldia sp.]